MLSTAATRPSFSIPRKWSIGLSVAVSLLAVSALVGMANYLSVRYFKRFHWTSNQAYILSPLTQQMLKSLTNEVRITIFFSRDEPLYAPVMALMNEYRRASPKLVVKEIDLLRDPSAGDLLSRKNPSGTDKNVLVFESNGKIKAVLDKELSEYDLRGFLAGKTQEVKRVGFKGEQLFTSAILTVSDRDGFTSEGGIIQFITDLKEKRIRLRINMAAAKAANLSISSKLLKLADID